MSNLSSFVASTTSNTEFSRYTLADGSGTLPSAFTNSTSGYLYGIYVRINTLYGSGSGYNSNLTLNTAISGQSNTTLIVNTIWDGSTTYGQRFNGSYGNYFIGMPVDLQSSSSGYPNIYGMWIPINVKFSGSTTINWSNTNNAGSLLYSYLFYDLD